MANIQELININKSIKEFDVSLNKHRITTPDDLEDILELMNSVERCNIIEKMKNPEYKKMFIEYIENLCELIEAFEPMKTNTSDFPSDLLLPDDIIRLYSTLLQNSIFDSLIIKIMTRKMTEERAINLLNPVITPKRVHRR